MDSLIIAFSMYSKIPMPRREWTEKGMKYAICFFPMVGMVIGLIVFMAGKFLFALNMKGIFLPCIMSVIPLFITGGIHMDGFLDTMDGISSYQTKEKRLMILKDSNSGAFAIIGGLVYMTISIGAWSEISLKSLPVIVIGYTLSRAISGLCLLHFKQARKEGLAAAFSGGASPKAVTLTMFVYMAAAFAVTCIINPYGACILVLAALISGIIHYYNCMHNFGGITGDLAGFFLQLMELSIIVLCMIFEMAGIY